METYHLKTDLKFPRPLGGFDRERMDGLFIPMYHVIGCFVDKGFLEGEILNYTDSFYLEKARKIIEGNKEGIDGDLIKEIDLEEETADKIARFCRDHNMSSFHITKKFDGSTEMLVRILSGEYRYKGIVRILDNIAEAVKVFGTDDPIPSYQRLGF